VPVRRDHFLPAAYIGGFSASAVEKSRDRKVWVNDRTHGVREKRACDIAYVTGLTCRRCYIDAQDFGRLDRRIPGEHDQKMRWEGSPKDCSRSRHPRVVQQQFETRNGASVPTGPARVPIDD
jgi:hypothetical protein